MPPNSNGVLKIIRTCKICQSPLVREITSDILSDARYQAICDKYNKIAQEQNVINPRSGEIFKISPTNVFAHKKHCDPSPIAHSDIKNQVLAGERYGEAVKLLYQLKYEKEFSKLEALLALYQGRIENIKFLEQEKADTIRRLKQIRRQIRNARTQTQTQEGRLDLHLIPPQEFETLNEIVALIDKIENIHSGLTGDLLQHLKLDKNVSDGSTTNIHINIDTLTIAFNQYMNGIMSAISEIFPGEAEKQKQLVIKVGELMDQHVRPMIVPRNSNGNGTG